jgi:FAD/FMN-containing dehydrogenase
MPTPLSDERGVPRAPRFALTVPVRLGAVGTGSWEFGHTINISRSGLLVAVPSSLRRADTIEAVVRLSEATLTVSDVWLRGRVARVAGSGNDRHVATTIDEYKFYSAHLFNVSDHEDSKPDVARAWMTRVHASHERGSGSLRQPLPLRGAGVRLSPGNRQSTCASARCPR